MFDITLIIEAALMLTAVIITTFVIPYIKSKTTAAQQQTINDWVKIAVSAAEQIYTGTGRGAEKKAHVLAFLNAKGVTLDVASIDAMIEAAVYELQGGIFELGEAVTVTPTETIKEGEA